MITFAPRNKRVADKNIWGFKNIVETLHVKMIKPKDNKISSLKDWEKKEKQRKVRIVQREHNIKFKVFTTESLILAQDER